MLRPDDRLFFIHIPKTAGTTLIPLIDRHFHASEICPAQLWRELVKLPQEDLPRYRLFRGHFGGSMLDPFLPRPPVCMTMLRHPVALARSTYRFILDEPGTRMHDLLRAENLSFNDFIHDERTWHKCSNRQARQLSNALEYTPTTGPVLADPSPDEVDEWVRSHRAKFSHDERLARAKEKLEQCAFFGLVERFEESMALMCYTFGWPPVRAVQKLRVARKKADDDLTPKEMARVRELNKLDFSLYEFAEELFDERLARMQHDLESRVLPPIVPGTMNSLDGSRSLEDLVDRAYGAARSAEPSPPQKWRFSFDEPIYGSGWHRREHSAIDGTTFCWTGPSAISTLDLDIDRSTDQRITIRLINALTQQIYDSFRLRAGGEPVALERIASESAVRVYQGVIPAAAGSRPYRFTRLAFEVNQTLSPRSLDPRSDDERAVGVAVNWLDVRPASVLEAGEMPEITHTSSEERARRENRRRARLREIKTRIAQLPIVGPRLRTWYLRHKG